jgi:hypothetical protein
MKCVFENEYQNIPELTKGGITRYVENHLPPGSFLSAVICGDLYTAVRRADPENQKAIVLIARWFDSYFPGLTGRENFSNWINKKENA